MDDKGFQVPSTHSLCPDGSISCPLPARCLPVPLLSSDGDHLRPRPRQDRGARGRGAHRAVEHRRGTTTYHLPPTHTSKNRPPRTVTGPPPKSLTTTSSFPSLPVRVWRTRRSRAAPRGSSVWSWTETRSRPPSSPSRTSPRPSPRPSETRPSRSSGEDHISITMSSHRAEEKEGRRRRNACLPPWLSSTLHRRPHRYLHLPMRCGGAGRRTTTR